MVEIMDAIMKDGFLVDDSKEILPLVTQVVLVIEEALATLSSTISSCLT